ncbi:DNA (cytosine-5)-methyltransferase 1, partial [Nowakowskiella sp. JEL0078]
MKGKRKFDLKSETGDSEIEDNLLFNSFTLILTSLIEHVNLEANANCENLNSSNSNSNLEYYVDRFLLIDADYTPVTIRRNTMFTSPTYLLGFFGVMGKLISPFNTKANFGSFEFLFSQKYQFQKNDDDSLSVWFIPYDFPDEIYFEALGSAKSYSHIWNSFLRSLSGNEISSDEEENTLVSYHSDSSTGSSERNYKKRLKKENVYKLTQIANINPETATYREYFNLYNSSEDNQLQKPSPIGSTIPFSALPETPHPNSLQVTECLEEDDYTFHQPMVDTNGITYFSSLSIRNTTYRVGDFCFMPFSPETNNSFINSQNKLALLRILEISKPSYEETNNKVELHGVWYFFGRDTILKQDFFSNVTTDFILSKTPTGNILPVVFATRHHQTFSLEHDLEFQPATVLHYRIPCPIPEQLGPPNTCTLSALPQQSSNTVVCLMFYDGLKGFFNLDSRDATICFDMKLVLPLARVSAVWNPLDAAAGYGEGCPTLRGVACCGEDDNGCVCLGSAVSTGDINRPWFGRGEIVMEGICVAVESDEDLFEIYYIDEVKFESDDVQCSGVRLRRPDELDFVIENPGFTEVIMDRFSRRTFSKVAVELWARKVRVWSTKPRMNGSCDEFYCQSEISVEGKIIELKENPFEEEPEMSNKSSCILNVLPGRTKPFNCLSLYSGIDGLGFGLSESGLLDVKWCVEMNSDHARSLHKNYPAAKIFNCPVSDVLISLKEGYWPATYKGSIGQSVNMEEIDIIVAGPPCQGHSLANRHPNSFGAREKVAEIVVFLEIVELVRPKFVIMENVTNFAMGYGRNQENNVYYKAKRVLLELGYQFVSPMLHAGMHGVPQSRERLFLIASYAGFPAPVYPEASHQ